MDPEIISDKPGACPKCGMALEPMLDDLSAGAIDAPNPELVDMTRRFWIGLVFTIPVFLLTMAALYGLGMMLASLFLLWGREAFHLTNLAIEPVYFISGLNFPVARLGALGAVAIATVPLAVGLDAMRQLAFPGMQGLEGTPPPQTEALILAAMTVVFLVASQRLIRTIERMARSRGSLSIRWQ